MKATTIISSSSSTVITLLHFFTISILLARSSVCSAFVRSYSHQSRKNILSFSRAPHTSSVNSSNQMAMSSSFANFLEQQNYIFEKNSDSKQHLIVGNPAGDADSIVSALSLAHIDHLLSSGPKVPIVSIPRADMTLRRETVLLLEMLQISTESLLYLDDLPPTGNGSTVTLVDHNQLVFPALLEKKYDVVEILDHHFDEKTHEHVTGNLRNIAFAENNALVASTCTLVAERWLAAKTESNTIPADLSFALLAVMLLDTVNMNPGAGKGTPRDKSVMDALVQQTDWSSLAQHKSTKMFFTSDGIEPDKTKLYDYLNESKFDIDFWKSLSVIDALRLDYKQFTAPTGDGVFGAASVLLPAADFVSKPNWEAQVLQYMSDCDIPLLAILSMTIVDDTPHRSMIICGITENDDSKQLVNAMVDHLQNTESLELTPVALSQSKELTAYQYTQGNAKASRKQVVPIMLDYYDKNADNCGA